MGCGRIFNALRRCKQLEDGDNSTQLDRCLGLLDLTALGVGSTLGVCYAEFAARVPKAGSAYVYSYVSVGEFIAFTIGWNLILELSVLLTSMPYQDCLVPVLLGIGVKESTKLNNVFTALNLITVIVVVIAGAVKSNPANWRIPLEDIPDEYKSQAGAGGFAPWGVAGIMAGAAKCFFGFVGFDCVATTGEEAKNPKRDIPLSIVLSLVVIFVSYFSIATVLTMMLPYYLQDADAPFPHVFTEANLPVIKWIVTIGAIFALCTSLLGAMFPLPRVLYAMGSDGVLFRPLAAINKRTQTPVMATILSGLLAVVVALATCALLRWEQAEAALGVLGAALLVLLVVLYRQPRNNVENLSFTVPLVPLVPYLSVCMNVYLMVQLDYQTWVRFIIWLAIGYMIYFFYGIRNSSLNVKNEPQTNGVIEEKRQVVTTKF
ncbi:hypothetical protein HF086_013514 [Spodoptera exigua]|uniref:Amino acid permease/ SLC12A domain-containing protein n=1 Tax=Spodoptera exigua TaxID=7107 RepID=A0A922M743_SPOEX|nr:hypothetical protein HF086_013514 [Spodoptera exigua]